MGNETRFLDDDLAIAPFEQYVSPQFLPSPRFALVLILCTNPDFLPRLQNPTGQEPRPSLSVNHREISRKEE